MSPESEQLGGWMISGFVAAAVLWVWVGVVLLYGLYRSIAHPEPDEIRPAGPTGSGS